MTIDVHAEMEVRHAREKAREDKDRHWKWGRHLKDLRERCDAGDGLSQARAAQRSGVHVKTLSSFETGMRIEAMKVTQLEKLCDAYGITLAQFFAEVP